MDTTSYWPSTATFPRFASLKKDCSVAVVIIAAAYLFKKQGHKVALLERGQCGGSDRLNTTAHLTFVTDTRLHKLVEIFGEAKAKTAWQAGLTAIQKIEHIIHQEKIACEFQWAPGCLIKGQAKPVVIDGQIQHDELSHHHLSTHDLMEDLRLNGAVDDVKRVKRAMIERSGEISVQCEPAPNTK